MESRYTMHIMPAEWRWVTVVSIGLVLLGFAPFLWVALSDTNQWQFMGALHNYQDAATYLAKMAQGEAGAWLMQFWHTPEPHEGALIQVLYLALGHLARLLSLPMIVIFHVARVGAALFMFLSLYQLAASIWQRVRTRRIFFAIASLGAGLGWFLAPLFATTSTLEGQIWPDLVIPEAFLLESTVYNVHFPLTLACLVMIVAAFITAFRPGSDGDNGVGFTLPVVAILSFALALLYPQSLVPLGGALMLFVLIAWLEGRRAYALWTARWLLAVMLPALPMALYYVIVVNVNPAFAEWNRQNVTLAPHPLSLILGFGLPLFLAVPAIWRSLRQFELADDRLMLLWLGAMIVCLYLPTNVQRRFLVGAMIPVAYFATRAIEDVWFRYISRRHRPYFFATLLPIISVSQLFTIFLPVLPVVSGNPASSLGLFLERDYALAFRWLEDQTTSNDVVLASPVVSTWMPGWAKARPVYGHPFETLDAEQKRAQVIAWYGGDDGDCMALIETYDVRFILVGPEEHRLGPAPCLDRLSAVATLGQVSVYAP